MKVQEIKSRIKKYSVIDEDTGAVCYYTLDLDKFELVISGEAKGNYRWHNTEPHETFIQLLKRCDTGYILGKLFKRKWSNEKAIKEAIDILKDYTEDFENFEALLEDINNIDSSTCTEFINQLSDICENNSNDPYFEDKFDELFSDFYEHDLEEWEYWDLQAVNWFVKYVAPILEE